MSARRARAAAAAGPRYDLGPDTGSDGDPGEVLEARPAAPGGTSRGRPRWARVLFGPGRVRQDSEPDPRATRLSQPARARVVATALWVLLALAAAGGAAGLAGAFAPPAAPPRASAATAPVADPGVAGFAELFMAVYLPAGAGQQDRLAPFLGTTPELTGIEAGRLSAGDTTAVAVRDAGRPGYWSVTVAVSVAAATEQGLRPLGLRYYQVPVAHCGADPAPSCPPGTPAPGYVIPALPALVAAPATWSGPATAPGQQLPVVSAPAQTVQRFLVALLTGHGELSRYCRSCAAPTEPVLSAIELSELRAVGAPTVLRRLSEPGTPADGTAVTVQATAQGTHTTGATQQLAYSLRLQVDAGQWVVDGIEPAPPLTGPAGPPRPTDPLNMTPGAPPPTR